LGFPAIAGFSPTGDLHPWVQRNQLILSERYWNLKKLFEAGLVAIDDDELAFELSKIKIAFLRSGKIKIIDKEIIKKELGGRSPDKAECMMLAYSMEYADVERELVRFL